MSGGAGEVNILQSLFSLQLPLTHKRLFPFVIIIVLNICMVVYVLCGYTTVLNPEEAFLVKEMASVFFILKW